MNRKVSISEKYKNVYFIGIGGIGMSALARYFNYHGLNVCGYDKTPSSLTENLQEEGCQIHFDDLGNDIPKAFQEKETTLVNLGFYHIRKHSNHGN